VRVNKRLLKEPILFGPLSMLMSTSPRFLVTSASVPGVLDSDSCMPGSSSIWKAVSSSVVISSENLSRSASVGVSSEELGECYSRSGWIRGKQMRLCLLPVFVAGDTTSSESALSFSFGFAFASGFIRHDVWIRYC
jgi:hypothetical protein